MLAVWWIERRGRQTRRQARPSNGAHQEGDGSNEPNVGARGAARGHISRKEISDICDGVGGGDIAFCVLFRCCVV